MFGILYTWNFKFSNFQILNLKFQLWLWNLIFWNLKFEIWISNFRISNFKFQNFKFKFQKSKFACIWSRTYHTQFRPKWISIGTSIHSEKTHSKFRSFLISNSARSALENFKRIFRLSKLFDYHHFWTILKGGGKLS